LKLYTHYTRLVKAFRIICVVTQGSSLAVEYLQETKGEDKVQPDFLLPWQTQGS
jgi:hypothetical protein